MRQIVFFSIFFFVRATSISPAEARSESGNTLKKPTYPWAHDLSASSVMERFSPPEGFRRTAASPKSFGYWLQHLPLKPGKPPVALFDGRLKANQNAHVAVLDIDVGNRDLQQCADAVMRLWAEYLRFVQRDEHICFMTAAGTAAKWTRWRDGYRPAKNAQKTWQKIAAPGSGYPNFKNYLKRVFGTANTASLLRQMDRVDDANDIRRGDVYIEGATRRGYGHAVIVIDVVENKDGKKAFLSAQSYMPAQQIHILKNPLNEHSPWFAPTEDGSLVTPEWHFGPGALHRLRKKGC